MALSAREQEQLDLIAADLTRRDPYLAGALSTFTLPITSFGGTRSHRRSARTVFGMLAALVLFWAALWGPAAPSSCTAASVADRESLVRGSGSSLQETSHLARRMSCASLPGSPRGTGRTGPGN